MSELTISILVLFKLLARKILTKYNQRYCMIDPWPNIAKNIFIGRNITKHILTHRASVQHFQNQSKPVVWESS